MQKTIDFILRNERYILRFTTVILVLALGFAISMGSKPSEHPRVGVSYSPSPSQFHLYNVRGIIYSSYWNEAGLLDYTIPVADIDMMLPYGAQYLVSLPGDRRDRYYYHGSVYIDGSGWVEKWSAPNGGRFAFLHMSSLLLGSGARSSAASALGTNVINKLHLQKPPKCHFSSCNNDVGDNNTTKVADYALSKQGRPVASSGWYYGGTAVGYSGWPSNPYYGNGTSGPSNAHLCLLLDQNSDNYFLYVAYRLPEPKPPKAHFVKSLWNYYRFHHHKSLIPAYYHRKLAYGALLWVNHEALCRSVVSTGKWHPLGFRGLQGYIKQRFQGCSIYFWPHLKDSKVKIAKERHYLP